MKRIIILATLALAACAAFGQTTNLSGRIYINPAFSYVKTSGAAVVSATFPDKLLDWSISSVATNPTGMTQFYIEQSSIVGENTRTINLSAVTNCFGDVMAFSKVKWVVFAPSSNNVDTMSLGADANHLPIFANTNWTMNVSPGAMFVYSIPTAAGLVATGKTVKVENAGTNTSSYSLYIGGVP